MTRSRTRHDPDNPPAQQESDFMGAEVLAAGERHAQSIGPLRFHVFRASQDPDLFAVTDQDEVTKLPACPAGSWVRFRVLPETGKPRVGLSEAAAKREIASQGYHLVRMTVVIGEDVRRG